VNKFLNYSIFFALKSLDTPTLPVTSVVYVVCQFSVYRAKIIVFFDELYADVS